MTAVYGRTRGSDYGFPKIMEICDRYACKATFFVDVLEYARYGKTALGDVCRSIGDKGHDVQLHTHPANAYDARRKHMHLYSLAEQKAIIEEGKELIREWTGEYPVAHRAGAYGINHDTLVALREGGIPIDSSAFYGHPNSHVVPSKNRVVELDGVVEIPVTVFLRRRQVKLGRWVVRQRARVVKTDVDAAIADELARCVQEAKQHDIRVMNLFMHSYSLVSFAEDYRSCEPDWRDIEKLEAILELVAGDPEVRVITMKECWRMYQHDPEQFAGSDHVPVIASHEPFSPVTHGARAARALVRTLRSAR